MIKEKLIKMIKDEIGVVDCYLWSLRKWESELEKAKETVEQILLCDIFIEHFAHSERWYYASNKAINRMNKYIIGKLDGINVWDLRSK